MLPVHLNIPDLADASDALPRHLIREPRLPAREDLAAIYDPGRSHLPSTSCRLYAGGPRLPVTKHRIILDVESGHRPSLGTYL